MLTTSPRTLKTQKEVSQKLKAVTASINDGTYIEPCKMTVGEWMDIWSKEYLSNVKPHTVDSYLTTINHRIKPGLGATRLDQLTPHTVQSFYNSLGEDNDEKGALYPTKNDKRRTIALSNFVLTALRRAHRRKLENKLLHGPAWEDSGFVFTDELGHHLKHQTVYLEFKKIVTEIGAPNARFHDLRHSFAVSSIRAGDDIKTVQEHLGHATAAFTLDVYGHVTDQMHKESAVRMDRFIENILTG